MYSWVISHLVYRVKFVYISVCVCAQSCPTFYHPMDYSPPGSSVHAILQSILELVAMPFSRGSSQARDQTHMSYISCISRWILYHSATL